LGVRVSGWR